VTDLSNPETGELDLAALRWHGLTPHRQENRVPSFGDLVNERSRRLLAEQLAALAEEEAAKPQPIPEAVFMPPPSPGDDESPTGRTAP
jgi:hypothetical protein